MYNEKLNIDDIVKQGLEGFEMDFDDQDWSAMESMLDEKPSNGFWAWSSKLKYLLGGLALLMIPALWYAAASNEKGVSTNGRAVISTKTSINSGMVQGFSPDVTQGFSSGVDLKVNTEGTIESKPVAKQNTGNQNTGNQNTDASPKAVDNVSMLEAPASVKATINSELLESQEVNTNTIEPVETHSDKPLLDKPSPSKTIIDSKELETNDSEPSKTTEPTMVNEKEVDKLEINESELPSEVALATERAEKLMDVSTLNALVVNSIPNRTLGLGTLPPVQSMDSDKRFKMPLGAKLKMEIQGIIALNWNFTDKVKEGTVGYQAGLSFKNKIGKKFSIENNVLWNESAYYSTDLETPPYLWGSVVSGEVKYDMLEWQLMFKHYLGNNARMQPWIAAGHSTYFPVNEQYFFDTVDEDENEEPVFLNDYEPELTNNRFTSDIEGIQIAGRTTGTMDEVVGVSNVFLDPVQEEEEKNALLPSGQRTTVMAGIINLQTGFDLQLNRRNKISVGGQFKTSLKKKPFDLKYEEYEISNYKNLNSIGLQLGWKHIFG